MRSFGLGLIAALMVAVMAPHAAFAADKKDGPPPVTAAAKKKGMADAPKVIQAAGLSCQPVDARMIGSVPEDKKNNTPARDFYEVACQGGAGYVIAANKGGDGAEVNSCIETVGGSLTCLLPENADVTASLQPALQKAHVPCTVDKVRGIGSTSTSSLLEVSCQGGAGYVLRGSKPFDPTKEIKAENCIAYDGGTSNIKCTLNDASVRMQAIDKYVTAANVPCTVKERRFVGVFKDGSEGYEVACNEGKGYILKVASTGAVTPEECVKAPGLCELSDARQAQTEQAALYTRLAKQAGANCDVASYAMFPSQQGKDVLELTCKSGVDMVGIFPVGGKGQVLDCGRAIIEGYKCAPGKAKYDGLTADLQKLGKSECVVSEVSPRAKSAKGNAQIEVACTDGKPGYLMEYSSATTPVQAIGCRLAGCVMPANKPKT
jgi:hypothetical protein